MKGGRGASSEVRGHRNVHPVESRAITSQGTGYVVVRTVRITTNELIYKTIQQVTNNA